MRWSWTFPPVAAAAATLPSAASAAWICAHRSAVALRGAEIRRPKREYLNSVAKGLGSRYSSIVPSIAPSPAARVVCSSLPDVAFVVVAGAVERHAVVVEGLAEQPVRRDGAERRARVAS